MILATWNCWHGPVRDKLAVLAHFNADVVVVPELPRIRPDCGLWSGENPKKGLAIIPSRTTKLVQIMDIPDLPDYAILTHVTGSMPFLLLAVWAKQWDHYVEGLHRVLTLCQKRIALYPTVLLGDFNSNTKWDHKEKRKQRGVSHTDLVKRLDDLGLVSAYHSYFAENHGQERQPTFYLRREQSYPSHIDYCFVPKAWTITRVTVGSYDDWKAESDHMPLIVHVEEKNVDGKMAYL